MSISISKVSVVVIGGGPAGISAAIAAASDGVSVLLVDRSKQLGGKLNQSIHDSFGFTRFDKPVTGPEYAYADISLLNQTNATVLLQTAVLRIAAVDGAFQLTMSNRFGFMIVESKAVVFATGCRERTALESGVFGTKPAGMFTAGEVQYYMNVMGQLPVKNCFMLGTTNLGLAVSDQLALEESKLISVYEPKKMPSGYLDYATRCIFDHDIPLYTEHTVTTTVGSHRLRGIGLSRVDSAGAHIRGSENVIRCDSLIIAGGLIPDNELASTLNVTMNEKTNGPVIDQNGMTLVDGVYCCGNALNIIDLVDYISESGGIAGRGAARFMAHSRNLVKIDVSNDFSAFLPQCIDTDILHSDTVMFFNSATNRQDATVSVLVDGSEVYTEQFESLRPNETQRISVRLSGAITAESKVTVRMS